MIAVSAVRVIGECDIMQEFLTPDDDESDEHGNNEKVGGYLLPAWLIISLKTDFF